MTAPLVIRPAARSDVIVLTDLALRSKASHGYDEAFMALCREELAIHEQTLGERDLWVAEADGRILGFFGLEPPEDGVAVVNPIFVEPSLQQSGVGRSLWQKLEERARLAGAWAIGLDSDPHSVGFYEKMGCRMIGWSASGSIPGRRLPKMEKPLDERPSPNIAEIIVLEARARIVATAKRMLAGECSYIEGSRIISNLVLAAGGERLEQPFATFVGIDSSTDHIPLGDELKRWQRAALRKLRPDWDQSEAWAKKIGEAACREIISVLSTEPRGDSPAG
jgi:N-acetylglutamate synthase-like GNAT family acetyltransferase